MTFDVVNGALEQVAGLVDGAKLLAFEQAPPPLGSMLIRGQTSQSSEQVAV